MNPSAQQKVRLMIVDDHPLIRAGLAMVLKSEIGFEVVGEASSGMEATRLCDLLQPDVVLLDIRMPGGSGLDACRWIKDRFSNIKVVFLTSYADDACLVDAIASGADGYVLKTAQNKDLIDSISKVMGGGAFADSISTQRLFSHIAKRSGAGARGVVEDTARQENAAGNGFPVPNTTPVVTSNEGDDDKGGKLSHALSLVERRIMDLVVRGRLNKEIGTELGLAEKSIRNHLTRIFVKLQVINRTQASDVWRNHAMDSMDAKGLLVLNREAVAEPRGDLQRPR